MSDVDLSSIWFQTYKGNRFYPYKPEKIIIDIEEIAHALSNRCRWGGHSLEFYSVAQHSVLVSRNCPQSPTWGLLHDAAEAYYPDIPRPLKISPDIKMIVDLENRLLRTIAQHFNLCPDIPDDVRRVDAAILTDERRFLMCKTDIDRSDWGDTFGQLDIVIQPVNQNEAKELFLGRARELHLS
ncbi:hypothetical protein LCGC14_2769660 [marine sediment metagenome]|uniref:HD domain-containing protein n=1 Tax=marine sediment metagenome TaxID=412755 RepID=A0A0F9BN23_9ZZZZ